MFSTPLILVVEDTSDDFFFLERAFSKAGIDVALTQFTTAEDAVQFFLSHDSSLQFPSLLLLDLKLPGMTGHDLLRWIRTQPQLKPLPVVILSGSVLESDKSESMALGADAYFSKPPGVPEYASLAEQIYHRWLKPSPDPQVSALAKAL